MHSALLVSRVLGRNRLLGNRRLIVILLLLLLVEQHLLLHHELLLVHVERFVIIHDVFALVITHHTGHHVSKRARGSILAVAGHEKAARLALHLTLARSRNSLGRMREAATLGILALATKIEPAHAIRAALTLLTLLVGPRSRGHLATATSHNVVKLARRAKATVARHEKSARLLGSSRPLLSHCTRSSLSARYITILSEANLLSSLSFPFLFLF